MKTLGEIRATLEGLRGSSLSATCDPLGAALSLAGGRNISHPPHSTAASLLGWPLRASYAISRAYDDVAITEVDLSVHNATEAFSVGIDEGIAWIDRQEQAES